VIPNFTKLFSIGCSSLFALISWLSGLPAVLPELRAVYLVAPGYQSATVEPKLDPLLFRTIKEGVRGREGNFFVLQLSHVFFCAFALRTAYQHKAIKVIYRMKEQDLMSRVKCDESKQ
jgi:hypothetical protein